MPSFNIISNGCIPDQYKTPEWEDAKKFTSYGRLVNKRGNYIKPKTIEFEAYQLKFKKVRQLSRSERFESFLAALAVVICSLGLALISKEVRNSLLLKPTESVRFAELHPSCIKFTLPKLPVFKPPVFDQGNFPIKQDKNAFLISPKE